MKKQRFHSLLGQKMKNHLELRRSLGVAYQQSEYDLAEFERYILEHFPSCKTITREMVIGYLNCCYCQPRTRKNKLNNIRQFCRYMFQFDVKTYIPEKGLIGPAKTQIKPYIFTEEEICKLIQQTKNLRDQHTLLPYTYATIIGLLWVSGMRISEVVNLKIEDVDTVEGILYIRQTKFFKSRLIPLSASSINALIEYKKQRLRWGYTEEPHTAFFLNKIKKPCASGTTSKIIIKLMAQIGLKTSQGKTPRVHDIRHSWATRWILDFYKLGKDPNTYLAALATYLGHSNITNTQVYLHPSIELLNIAAQKVQSYTRVLSRRRS
jgi:integrase/recombinase XerD